MKGGDFLTPRPKYVPDFQAGMGLLRFHRSALAADNSPPPI